MKHFAVQTSEAKWPRIWGCEPRAENDMLLFLIWILCLNLSASGSLFHPTQVELLRSFDNEMGRCHSSIRWHLGNYCHLSLDQVSSYFTVLHFLYWASQLIDILPATKQSKNRNVWNAWHTIELTLRVCHRVSGDTSPWEHDITPRICI
jgi:hypothetical protein